jgi:hypothetical protein
MHRTFSSLNESRWFAHSATCPDCGTTDEHVPTYWNGQEFGRECPHCPGVQEADNTPDHVTDNCPQCQHDADERSVEGEHTGHDDSFRPNYRGEDPFTPRTLPKPQNTVDNINKLLGESVLHSAVKEAISQGDDPTEISLFLRTAGITQPGLVIQAVTMQTTGSFTYNGGVHCNACAEKEFGDPNASRWNYMGENRPKQGFGPSEEDGTLDLHGAHCDSCGRHIADGYSHSPDECTHPEGQCPTNYSDHFAGNGCDSRGFSDPVSVNPKTKYINYNPMDYNATPHGNSNTPVHPENLKNMHELKPTDLARHPQWKDRAFLSALASDGSPGGDTGDEQEDLANDEFFNEGGMGLRGDHNPFDAMVHFAEDRCNNCGKKIYDSSGNGDWVHKNPDYSGFHSARPKKHQDDDSDEYIVRVHAAEDDHAIWEPSLSTVAGPLALAPELLAGGEAAGAGAAAGEAGGMGGLLDGPAGKILPKALPGNEKDKKPQQPTNGKDEGPPDYPDAGFNADPNKNLNSAGMYLPTPEPALPFAEGTEEDDPYDSVYEKDLAPMGGDTGRTANLDVSQLQVGLGWLNGSQSGSGGSHGASEIAAEARKFLQKSALKDFTPAEQMALIAEGEGITASNLDRLKIEGTHYEYLEAALSKEDEDPMEGLFD